MIANINPEGIFETPVGLDPDFRSHRTRTLGLTRDPPESQFLSVNTNIQMLTGSQLGITLHPITWLSFWYHTAFYGVPFKFCKINTFYLAILSNIVTDYFKAWKQELVLYVCLFYLYFKWCNSLGFFIMLDSKFW